MIVFNLEVATTTTKNLFRKVGLLRERERESNINFNLFITETQININNLIIKIENIEFKV